MEPLGTITSRSANDTGHVISARQIDQARIAEADSAKKAVKGSETETSPRTPPEVPSEKIDLIARALLNYVRSMQRDLSIQVHRGTGEIMVQVISKTDGKVIREIPPKGLLDLAAKMEEVVGVIFDENA
jgi:flagellar protein FlaG